MKKNFKVNFPHLELPPDSWFDLTDEQREKATCASPAWKFGILPPDEFKKI